MFGRLFSLISLSWGNGGMVVDGASNEAPSFPPYGTFIETLYSQEVPIANGGLYVTYQSTEYPNQTATVDKLADGSGGWFLDWANPRDTAYKTSQFTTYTTYSSDINIGGTSYGAGCTYYGDVVHDGMGGYQEIGTGGGCTPFGVYITSGGAGQSTIPTPIGDFAYETWDSSSYYHDGSGGYYEERNYTYNGVSGDLIGIDYTAGSSSREVPDMSGNYFSYESWDYSTLYYNGSGGYYSSYNYTYQAISGDFITNDGTYDYYWDGSGGYYY